MPERTRGSFRAASLKEELAGLHHEFLRSADGDTQDTNPIILREDKAVALRRKFGEGVLSSCGVTSLSFVNETNRKSRIHQRNQARKSKTEFTYVTFSSRGGTTPSGPN